ncbi:MAG: SDR family NAD(P)-dependent oxidoreductase [Pseudomonadota bacterium]
MSHPAIAAGRVAVITGAASGIGLAVAQQLSQRGMRVCLADLDQAQLDAAVAQLPGEAIGVATDVADIGAVENLRDTVLDRFGEVAVLMNNAGTSGRGATSFAGLDQWQKILGVNLWGIVHGLQTFTQLMIDQGTPAAIINTGSKQGITNPPGNAAYNVSKAGVKSVTESLAHDLRQIEGCQVSAHLLVPGFTYTGMIARFLPEKPDAAWTPDQVAKRLLEAMTAGDFYVICPDNDVSPALDQARMRWNTEDMTQNRPALSRWHADFTAAHEAFVAEQLGD